MITNYSEVQIYTAIEYKIINIINRLLTTTIKLDVYMGIVEQRLD